MTDKERLEKLKNGSAFDIDDINWLLQQAELVPMYEKAAGQMNEVLAQINAENLSLRDRVQELEKRCHYLNNELFSERTIKNEFQQGIEEQSKRIKELERVLKFYADENNWLPSVGCVTDTSRIDEDNGEMARQIITTRKEA